MDSRLTLANFRQMIGAYGCPIKLHVSRFLTIQAHRVVDECNCQTEISTLQHDGAFSPDKISKAPWVAEFANGGTVEGDGSKF